MPIPKWVKNTPMNSTIATSNYIFVWGEGVDSTRALAKQKAFADAVRKGLYELQAVRLSAQAISDIEKNGLSAATIHTNRAIRECCAAEIIPLGDKRYKAYLLIQMQSHAAKETYFYTLPPSFECYDEQFERDLEQWNKDVYKRMKRSDWTNHIAWSGVTASYPLSVTTGINGRHGKTVGFGWYANVGIGWRSVKVSEWETTSYYSDTYVPAENYYKNKPYFAYEAGVKFYPYKGAFLSLGYGTLGTPCDYAYSSFKEWQSATEAGNELWKKQVNSGMIAKVGWDFMVFDGLWYFSVNGGVGYDLTNKTWTPAFSVSLMGFGGYINKK